MEEKDIFKKLTVLKKTKKITHDNLALMLACILISRKEENKFTQSNINTELNSHILDDELKIRDLAKELNSNCINNATNKISANGKGYYKIIGKKGNSNIFFVTEVGINKANDLMLEHFEVENHFDIKYSVTSANRVTNILTNLTIKEIYDKFEKKEFMIPRYQRGYVWEEKQASSLLYSITKNYPIGSFLTWSQSYNNGSVIEYVIDGQQRTQTLIKIYTFPMKYVNAEVFDNFITNNDKWQFHKVEPLVKEYKNIPREEIDNYKLKDKENLLSTEERIEFEELIKVFSRKITDGNETTYPSISIQDADEDNIIEIFEFLNTKGTPLTPFEILASKWAKHTIALKHNQDWKDEINTMYVNNIANDVRTREKVYTPSEIFFISLNRSFKNGDKIYQKLFFKNKNDGEGGMGLNTKLLMPMLWFFRVWYVKQHNDDISKVNFDSDFDIKLGKYIADVSKNNFDEIKRLVRILKKVWNDIYVSLPILKKIVDNDTIISSISKNLFISMAAQVLHERLEDESYKINNKLQYYFITAILNKDFASATDKRLRDDIKALNYLNEDGISIEKIKQNINLLNEDQRRESDFHKGFKSTVKFIIAGAYGQITKSKSLSYDFDHIFPKAAMAKLEIRSGVHTIGNCGRLSSDMNRKKRDNINSGDLLNDLLADYVKGSFKDRYRIAIGKILSDEYSKDEKQKIFDDITRERYDYLIKYFIEEIRIDGKSEFKNTDEQNIQIGTS